MNVACPQCASVFRVDPAKVPAGGVRARCSICGGVIPVPEPAVSVATPASGMEAILTPPPGTPAMSTPATPSPATETPATPAAAMPTSAEEAHAMPAPAEGTPAGEFATTAEYAAPPPATAEHAAPAGAPVADGSPESGTASHFNPYLQRDPHQRAKRLARALASDIVTYYPDKHAEAVRDGTFRELFDEEIRKSYEDYVSQVGAELAESTTYFQDAMNEVLARGKRVF